MFYFRVNIIRSFLFLIINLVFFSLFTNHIKAQVVINEISSSTSSDWIELYAFEDVDLSGWVLDDFDTDTKIKEYPPETFLGPSSSSYLVENVGNRLNRDGDIVTLFDKNGVKIDEISYGNKGGVCIPSDTGSIGRCPDANSTVERFSSPSKNSSNKNSILEPCPAPTNVPTDTPTPSPKPDPTSTPIPTLRPTGIPTKLPTPTRISTETLTADNEEEKSQILGSGDDEVNNDPDTQVEDFGNDKSPFPLAAGLFIFAGLGLIGIPVANYFRLKRGYNQKDV